MAKININGVKNEKGTGFTPVPEGVYEAIITRVNITTFSSGNPGLNLMLTIRTDVEQPCGNRKLFDNLVLVESSMYKYDLVAEATGFPEDQEITSLEQFRDYILHKPVQVKVLHEPDKYNPEKTRERISTYKKGLELSEDTELPATEDEVIDKMTEQVKDIIRKKREKKDMQG
ncbi:hypothetical protein BAG01nite_47750 [Brevibacillus agri]|uniref:DUF669 domain-containing protein n=1 Tax=Brevibacillus agri TaxID=51101 RepID=A0A3M8AMJ4_9BACL|nr:DUF669 domain-containing protein [Brevibacillus agri]QAV11856.1 hypothetical protein BA6348_03250 [Brevibacillus agri]RNB51705.1 DUF669 domain-containing protein [Brevibacillus agri]GED28673.1 hypothetical protein BAG01nite_47750 [Brevibacillus agri]